MSKGNSRKRAVHILYGRTWLILLAVAIQAVALALGFIWLAQYRTYFSVGFRILSAVLVIYIVNSKSNPAVKLAWIIPMLLFPVFGGLTYAFVKLQPGPILTRRRLRKVEKETKLLISPQEAAQSALTRENAQEAHLSAYLYQFVGCPVYENTELTYFPTGEAKWEALLSELEKAQSFIFLEYFILEEGVMWNRVLEILRRKAAEGVEVRLMYDGMGSLSLVPHSYPDYIRQFGIACKVFQPLIPVLDFVQNYRDHRKIVVIDGKVAMTGGINLADEYINRKQRFGYWKDTGIMLKGEAVRSFTLMFLQMWNITGTVPDDYRRYLEAPVYMPESRQDGFVIPYGDSPLDDENIGEYLYMDILNTARKYVHIMTPYLIVDHEMQMALSYAAKRGVDVKIILPHIPDKKIAFMLARSYYPHLLEAGVKIYEYTPGFVHAKVFTSDGTKAVVGTVNLDYRSFYHHFECGLYMTGCQTVRTIEEDFHKTLSDCQLMTAEAYKKLNPVYRLLGHVFKLFAPLM